MRKTFSAIYLTSLAFLATGCGSSDKKGGKPEEAQEEQTAIVQEALEYTELKKTPLPCPKEELYTAWKKIGAVELQRKKSLDYTQHTPALFLSTDLDKDGNPEVLLRSEPPYAAIFTFRQDSLQLITFADQAEMGLAITPEGVILRNGRGADGSSITEFIRLKDSQISASGSSRETFVIKDGKVVSGGVKHMLRSDTAMVEVSRETYQQVAPQQDGTYFEDIEGWEDFRKP